MVLGGMGGGAGGSAGAALGSALATAVGSTDGTAETTGAAVTKAGGGVAVAGAGGGGFTGSTWGPHAAARLPARIRGKRFTGPVI
jgi:hypothetical protein